MNHPKKEQVFGVTLRRRDRNVSWGVRIIGGADLGTPILVTGVWPGSPGDQHLAVGDVIKKIGDYDARDISHLDATNLFLEAGTSIKLDVMRAPKARSGGESQMSHRNTEVSGNLSGNRKIVFPPPNPIRLVGEGSEEFGTSNQPYRTTPLVLPGAKAKHEKELAPTESYLRHHPNPMMRAPPSQYEFVPQEVVMKQRVADSVLQKVVGDEAFAGKQVVHKQFNSPIGLYSNQNIVDTIRNQTGIAPSGTRDSTFAQRPITRTTAPRKTVVYDPAKSETFRALQEEQYGDQVEEVTTPAQPKVFAPNIHGKRTTQHQAPHAHTYDPLSKSAPSPSLQHHLPYVNSMGHSEEQIAQSGTFKRLMNMVMAESDY